jgi:glycosyltransferase involved in cell wall biosynthesis
MIIGHVFPTQWWPVINGSDTRHLQIRRQLQGLGHEVISLSNFNKKRMWTTQSMAHFRSAMGELAIFNTNEELHNIIKNRHIDMLVVDYIDNGAEYNIPSLDVKTVLCVHDIGSHNLQYEKHLKSIIRTKERHSIDDIPLADSSWELDEIVKYDKVITIAEHERLYLADKGISSVHIPYTPTIRPIKNTYEGFPLTLAGQSMVNLHGLSWFENDFGTRLFSRMPDVRVEVVGPINEWIDMGERFRMHGVVENLDTVFKNARFGICPVIFGTGQKIKILEMMGASLPVIAYKTRSAECPLDNTCGLLSDDTDEWMDMFRQLWLDRKKCRQMGEIAQHKVATWFPEEKQLEVLSSIL